MDADNRANSVIVFKIDDEVRMSGNLDLSIDAAIAQEQKMTPRYEWTPAASRRIRIGTYFVWRRREAEFRPLSIRRMESLGVPVAGKRYHSLARRRAAKDAA